MFADEDKSQVSDSPAREIARNQATTDRTSRMLFQIEAEIKNRYKKVITPFLMRSAVEIEWMLFGQALGSAPMMLPLKNRYGTYGYYLPPGVENKMWQHPNPGFEDLTEYPRIIITPHMGGDDLLIGQDMLMESLLVEVDGRVLPREQPESGVVRFTVSRLMIMLALSPSLELVTDWSDIAAVNSTSFSARLAPLRHSCRELFGEPNGIIGRFTAESRDQVKTQKISARFMPPRYRQ